MLYPRLVAPTCTSLEVLVVKLSLYTMVGLYVCADAVLNWRSMAAAGSNVVKSVTSSQVSTPKWLG